VVLEMEDVDDQSVLVEPEARVGRHACRGLGRRQRNRLDRPSGRRHSSGTGKTDDDAQDRPAHVGGRYASIMS
jgi:hypothetical protein